MPSQKQRYELPENLWPLWGAISWHHHEGLEHVNPTGFVSTEEQYAAVLAELQDMSAAAESVED
jgi:hypothetical protein